MIIMNRVNCRKRIRFITYNYYYSVSNNKLFKSYKYLPNCSKYYI